VAQWRLRCNVRLWGSIADCEKKSRVGFTALSSRPRRELDALARSSEAGSGFRGGTDALHGSLKRGRGRRGRTRSSSRAQSTASTGPRALPDRVQRLLEMRDHIRADDYRTYLDQAYSDSESDASDDISGRAVIVP